MNESKSGEQTPQTLQTTQTPKKRKWHRHRPYHRDEEYDSDLSDEEWALIEELIPQPKPGGRPAKYPRREIVNAILYINKNGCTWRALPHDLPPFRSVHNYFCAWRDEGVWHTVCDTLRKQLRQELGRDAEPSGGVIDTQSVRTTQKGGLQTA
jgi:transposase